MSRYHHGFGDSFGRGSFALPIRSARLGQADAIPWPDNPKFCEVYVDKTVIPNHNRISCKVTDSEGKTLCSYDGWPEKAPYAWYTQTPCGPQPVLPPIPTTPPPALKWCEISYVDYEDLNAKPPVSCKACRARLKCKYIDPTTGKEACAWEGWAEEVPPAWLKNIPCIAAPVPVPGATPPTPETPPAGGTGVTAPSEGLSTLAIGGIAVGGLAALYFIL